MCLLCRYFKVGDFEVLAEGLAEVALPVGEPAAVGLSEQPAERCMGGGLAGQVCLSKRSLPVTGSVPA